VAYSGERPSGKRKYWSESFLVSRRLDYERIRREIADTRALVALDNLIVYEHMPRRSENPSLAALRQRAYRERQKIGMRTLRVDVSCDVIERLIDWGWISPDEARDDAKLQDAVEGLLECWVSETLTSGPIVTT
jgi:hypothetical protein